MKRNSIFSYSNPRRFILDAFALRQKELPGFSVRMWAKEMGLPSHSLLVMLLQGKRPLRIKHATFLSKGLHLSAQETLYLQALIQFESAASPEERELCALWLTELNPGRDFKIKEMESFIAISHWLYTAILSMTDLKDFDFCADAITKRLRGAATLHEVKSAVERLHELGLLETYPDGKTKCTYEKVTTPNDIRDVGVRRYHQAASELAKEKVEELAPELREFQSFSFAIDASKIPLAKEMIRKFRSQFVKAIGSDMGDEVFQMNIQFFQLTESRASRHAQDEGVDTEAIQTHSQEKENEKNIA